MDKFQSVTHRAQAASAVAESDDDDVIMVEDVGRRRIEELDLLVNDRAAQLLDSLMDTSDHDEETSNNGRVLKTPEDRQRILPAVPEAPVQSKARNQPILIKVKPAAMLVDSIPLTEFMMLPKPGEHIQWHHPIDRPVAVENTATAAPQTDGIMHYHLLPTKDPLRPGTAPGNAGTVSDAGYGVVQNNKQPTAGPSAEPLTSSFPAPVIPQSSQAGCSNEVHSQGDLSLAALLASDSRSNAGSSSHLLGKRRWTVSTLPSVDRPDLPIAAGGASSTSIALIASKLPAPALNSRMRSRRVQPQKSLARCGFCPRWFIEGDDFTNHLKDDHKKTAPEIESILEGQREQSRVQAPFGPAAGPLNLRPRRSKRPLLNDS